MSAAATKHLLKQYKEILRNPIEGVMVEADEDNIFRWTVWLEGPSDSAFAKGVYKMVLEFPGDYPMNPPELKFLSDFFHPNVYSNGDVCISILHSPGEDVMSGELPGERWMPTQSPTTILLSVMSMLADPNFNSPANVEASVEWQRNYELYEARCAQLAEESLANLPSHVVIPHPDTNPQERKRAVEKLRLENTVSELDEFEFDENPFELHQSSDHEAIDQDDESNSANEMKSGSLIDGLNSELGAVTRPKNPGKEKESEPGPESAAGELVNENKSGKRFLPGANRSASQIIASVDHESKGKLVDGASGQTGAEETAERAGKQDSVAGGRARKKQRGKKNQKNRKSKVSKVNSSTETGLKGKASGERKKSVKKKQQGRSGPGSNTVTPDLDVGLTGEMMEGAEEVVSEEGSVSGSCSERLGPAVEPLHRPSAAGHPARAAAAGKPRSSRPSKHHKLAGKPSVPSPLLERWQVARPLCVLSRFAPAIHSLLLPACGSHLYEWDISSQCLMFSPSDQKWVARGPAASHPRRAVQRSSIAASLPAAVHGLDNCNDDAELVDSGRPSSGGGRHRSRRHRLGHSAAAGTLRVVSFSVLDVCGFRGDQRMEMLLDELQAADADIVCLQGACGRLWDKLSQCDWVRSCYSVVLDSCVGTATTDRSVHAADLELENDPLHGGPGAPALLVLSRVRVVGARVHQLPTKKRSPGFSVVGESGGRRRLLVVAVSSGPPSSESVVRTDGRSSGGILLVGTAQLDPGDREHRLRELQLTTALAIMEDTAANQLVGGQAHVDGQSLSADCLLALDARFGETGPENQSLPAVWRDVWSVFSGTAHHPFASPLAADHGATVVDGGSSSISVNASSSQQAATSSRRRRRTPADAGGDAGFTYDLKRNKFAAAVYQAVTRLGPPLPTGLRDQRMLLRGAGVWKVDKVSLLGTTAVKPPRPPATSVAANSASKLVEVRDKLMSKLGNGRVAAGSPSTPLWPSNRFGLLAQLHLIADPTYARLHNHANDSEIDQSQCFLQ